jgi:hypothetical protein
MKFFPILLAIGFLILMFGIGIPVAYDNCGWDIRTGGRQCVDNWLHQLAPISIYFGLACILASFAFLRKKKPSTDIFER